MIIFANDNIKHIEQYLMKLFPAFNNFLYTLHF